MASYFRIDLMISLHIWHVKIGEKVFLMGDTYDFFNGLKTSYVDAYAPRAGGKFEEHFSPVFPLSYLS